EGPAYGAALLAAVGAGAFPDLAAAARRTLTREPLAYPDAQAHRAYQALYDRFRASYPASRPHGNTDPRIGRASASARPRCPAARSPEPQLGTIELRRSGRTRPGLWICCRLRR